jgi:carbamoyltransferase
MKILGLHDGHGSSVSLLIDGEIRACYEEERFSRLKGDSGFPLKAASQLKIDFPNDFNDIDAIAVSTMNHDFSLFATKRYPLFGIKQFLIEEERYWVPTLINGKKLDYLDVMSDFVDYNYSPYDLNSIKDKKNYSEIRSMRKVYIANYFGVDQTKVFFVDHHTCHAHHAFFSSPLRENVLIITMDGAGDNTNATIHTVKDDGKLKCEYRTGICNIGRVYQYITQCLGMKQSEHEYKVMGLAAYAKEHYITEPLKVFEETYYVDGLEFKSKVPIDNHYQYFKERLEGFRFDAIAGAVQRWSENLIVGWVKNWIKHTGLKNIVFSGGVALNIKASKKIAELDEVNNIFVCMAGGDESTSIGAAQYIWNKLDNNPKILQPITKPYLSAGFNSSDIDEALKRKIVKNNYDISKNIKPKKIAELLAEGNIVAFMSGKMEFGPRSLGHRSILADPRDINIVSTINEAIKNRDFWMPFTPSILDEYKDIYLMNPKNLYSPYMTMAFESTDRAQKDLPAAIHSVDKTIRPQIVYKELSPVYYQIIKEFELITGAGALLNTSFNIHGKPIVYKPIHAVEEVLSHELADLRYVVFEDILLSKR